MQGFSFGGAGRWTQSFTAGGQNAPVTWCKGNGESRLCGSSCTKSPPAARQNAPETWCKGNGKSRLCGCSCTKSSPVARQNAPKTWCKGNGKSRLCGCSCTKSSPAARQNAPETWCKGNGESRLCGSSCTKSSPPAAEFLHPRPATRHIKTVPAMNPFIADTTKHHFLFQLVRVNCSAPGHWAGATPHPAPTSGRFCPLPVPSGR